MRKRFYSVFFIAVLSAGLLSRPGSCFAETKEYETKSIDSPIVVNGDTVEYSADAKQAVASGNVFITYQGTTLSCEKVTVNTLTKDAVAEGNVLIKDAQQGVMSGKKVIYNFGDKTGTVIDGEFMSPPYFGRADEISKISDTEFRGIKGYATTCSMDVPHYRVVSKRIIIYPGDRIKTEKDIVYIGNCPIAYLPFFNHSLKEPLMHVQFSPGHSKDWGYYLLSAWRYYVSDNFSGRIYLDYRDALGVGSGFGTNYNTEEFGRGDLKFYYTQERPLEYLEEQAAEFERSLFRWRHKWVVDENTDFISEFYKIDDAKRAVHGSDHNILKDYFYREYEKDSQPRSYAQLHRNFDYSSMDVLVQSRVNGWYNPGFVEKLPEVTYSMPSYQFGESSFYFESSSSAANLNLKNRTTTTPDSSNVHVNRLDTTNKLSMPMKLSFLQVRPFAGTRETFYDKDLEADARMRTIFLTGTDVSTKFYRIFDVNTDALGLNLKGLRHVVTPSVGYAYDHEPTIPGSKLRSIDSVDAITYSSNRATLSLVNTFQTKRGKKTVDIGLFQINNSYYIRPKGASGSYMGDYNFDLELKPYSWGTFYADAIYSHRYDYFSNANYDMCFNLGAERSVSFGQRYQRKGANEFNFGSDWRLTPIWKIGTHQRFQFNETPTVKGGWRYQEYRISRDLHCWIADLAYTYEKDHGNTIWLVFKLKAFPETQFQFDQSYHTPKAGSQNY